MPIKKGDKESVVDFGLMLERDSQMPRIQINAELPDDKELLVNMARVLESVASVYFLYCTLGV